MFGYVAANRAGALAGRIRREMKAQVGDCYTYVCIHNSGLDGGALIFRVDFEDAIHARKGHQDAALTRKGSAGKAGACAAAHYGNLITVRYLDDADYVGSRSREGNAVWPRDFH